MKSRVNTYDTFHLFYVLYYPVWEIKVRSAQCNPSLKRLRYEVFILNLKKMYNLIFVQISLLIVVLISSLVTSTKYIDLSYSIGNKTVLWPTHRRLQKLVDSEQKDGRGQWYKRMGCSCLAFFFNYIIN